MKEIVDNMDSIAKDLSVSYADRLNAEENESQLMLRDEVEASISSSESHTALEKIVEKSNSRERLET